MKCLFLTRCYKTTNLKRIQENLESVFRNTDHTYRHIILADLTHGTDIDEFQQYSLGSGVYPIVKKPIADEYCTQAIDDCLNLVGDDPLEFVYVLDDDNLITPDFLAVLDRAELKKCDVNAVVFKVADHLEWGRELPLGESAVGKIDWSNFIANVFIFKSVGVFNRFRKSHDADGVFFDMVRDYDYEAIEYMDKICGCYNALPKP